jgi:rhodanese-related sulfurtransferase
MNIIGSVEGLNQEVFVMWRRFPGLLLLLLALLSAPAAAGVARDLSVAEARDLLQKDASVYLLDVRTPGEYLQVRLAGARLVPIDQLLRRVGELPRDRPILVYCTVGARSSQVFRYLAAQGYPEVYNLYGGISAWQLRGLPVQQGPP